MDSVSSNEICTERYGWFPPQVEDDCRKILNNHIAKRFEGKPKRLNFIRNHCPDFFLELKPKKTTKKKKASDESVQDEVDEEDESDEDLQLENFEENNLDESADEDDSDTTGDEEDDRPPRPEK